MIWFYIVIDWRVDGNPEHEIGGANPRVAEGALTMVCSENHLFKKIDIDFVFFSS
jgi:hypothetical protein